MTSVQEWTIKGEQRKARQMVLRGKWKGASADFLADFISFPSAETSDDPSCNGATVL